MARYQLSINQKNYDIDADPDMPVLWVLRDLLNLTGTKFGCGKGLCGACTLLFNGQAIRSCSFPVSAVGQGQLVTIEAVDKIAEYKKNAIPIKQAWIDYKVPQCGYCQPGQIMASIGLLNNQANASESQVKQTMSGNICRCGTYPRINQAILAVIQQGADSNE